MKLGDLLAVINEHEEVLVSRDGFLVDFYNGKDAISQRLNDSEVLDVRVTYATRSILVEIKED